MLLLTADSLAQCSKVVNPSTPLKTSQILYLSRLLLLFEYLIHNLYEPPRDLIRHVTHNIFRRFRRPESDAAAASTSSSPPAPTPTPLSAPPRYFPCRELEGAVNTSFMGFPDELRHSFYNLHDPPDLPSSQHEVPKLDGLALSFLLGASDIISYGQIYDALVTLLQVGRAWSASHYCCCLINIFSFLPYPHRSSTSPT